MDTIIPWGNWKRESIELPTINIKSKDFPSREILADHFFGTELTQWDWFWGYFHFQDGTYTWDTDTMKVISRMGDKFLEDVVPKALDKIYGKGHGLTFDATGESHGWLVVVGLPPLTKWYELDHQKWNELERQLQRTVAEWSTPEFVVQFCQRNFPDSKQFTAALKTEIAYDKKKGLTPHG